MSTIKQQYELTDEDGHKYLVNYKVNVCKCCGNCYEDELELYDEGGSVPYRLNVPGFELKMLLRGLLDGDYEVEKV